MSTVSAIPPAPGHLFAILEFYKNPGSPSQRLPVKDSKPDCHGLCRIRVQAGGGMSETGNGNDMEKDGKKVKGASGQDKKMPDGMVIAQSAQSVKKDADRI